MISKTINQVECDVALVAKANKRGGFDAVVVYDLDGLYVPGEVIANAQTQGIALSMAGVAIRAEKGKPLQMEFPFVKNICSR
jgi:hypothetical protein